MCELFSAFFPILTSFSLKPLTRNHSSIMVYYVFLIRVCDDHSATWHLYFKTISEKNETSVNKPFYFCCVLFRRRQTRVGQGRRRRQHGPSRPQQKPPTIANRSNRSITTTTQTMPSCSETVAMTTGMTIGMTMSPSRQNR